MGMFSWLLPKPKVVFFGGGVGEPVITLARSLESMEGWIKTSASTTDWIVYSHERYDLRVFFTAYPDYESMASGKRWECSCEWMTKDEQEYMVAVHLRLLYPLKAAKLKAERDDFNVLIMDRRSA